MFNPLTDTKIMPTDYAKYRKTFLATPKMCEHIFLFSKQLFIVLLKPVGFYLYSFGVV